MEHSHHPGQETDESAAGLGYCHWHPNVETRLFCGQCGKSMCTQCLVQVPVGIRCRECGKAVKMPTFDVQPTYYARAAGVAVGIGIGGGLLWAFFNFIFGGVPVLSSMAALAVGYAAGELISKSVNAKRSRGLAWMAAGSVLAAYVISLPSNPFGVTFFGIIFLGVAVYIAVLRVR